MVKHITRTLMILIGLGAVVALAVPAAASQAHIGRVASVARAYKVVRFGKCTANGDFAICTASGNVNHPSAIYVHIKSNPDQRISGAWSMVCTKGTGAGSKSGQINGTTPRRKGPLRMPYAHPDSCSVAADAQLSNSGSLLIYLTAHVPA